LKSDLDDIDSELRELENLLSQKWAQPLWHLRATIPKVQKVRENQYRIVKS
jgi:hypothetical protein